MELHEQPGAKGCASIALGGAHYGPTIIYMAKVDDAKTTTPWTASWFKVAQVGLTTPGPLVTSCLF
jgi:cellulase